MDQAYIKQELDRWMREVVETPNPALGNWAPCPYARQARVNNKIEIVFAEVADLPATVQANLPVLETKEVVIVCFDHNNIDPVSLQALVKATNQDLMKQNYVILEGHPDLPEYVSGVRLNFDACGMLVVQRLDLLNAAADKIRDKGYFEHWDKPAYDNIVAWRYPKE